MKIIRAQKNVLYPAPLAMHCLEPGYKILRRWRLHDKFHQYASLWLQEYATFPWKTFDDFSKWLYAGRLVTLPMMCSCQINLKTYVCKHAVGASIYFGLYIISDPDKLESLGKRRGRPKKAGPALAR